MDSINESLRLMNKNMLQLTKNMGEILKIIQIRDSISEKSEKRKPDLKNKGKRWTPEQDTNLTDFFNQYKSLEINKRDTKLAEKMARTTWSIHLRLLHLNLIEEDDPLCLRERDYVFRKISETW
jgi:hypothetical protein